MVAGVLSGTAPFGVIVSKMLAAGIETDVIINALEQKGVARSLAEPNLVALSGDTASFLAGGEYPIPVPGALGTVTVDYKRYGVGLAFTPTVLSGGLINLKIEPEVSQLDFSHMVTIGGLSVPPLIVRRASTTVELRDGQSFVIGGLLQSVGQNAISQMPWLGDVPVLGALFRSTSYQKNETDLAIIVTPRLVRPARPGDVIKTPLDASLPANDVDLFLMGKTELPPAKARLVSGVAAARIHRPHARSAEGRAPMCSRSATKTIVAHGAAGRDARRLLGILLRPPRHDLALRRRGDGRQPGDADDRSVAGGQRQPQHRLQRREGGDRGRALPHRPRHPAGQRHHQLGGLCGGAAAGAIHGQQPGIVGAERRQQQQQQPDQVRLESEH